MPFRSAPMRRLCLAAALLAAFPLPAAATEEPYGQTIEGWRFTQDVVNRVALCRAYSPGPTVGTNIERRGNGQWTMSVSLCGIPGVPRGRNDEASFEVGRSAEPVNATSDGLRLSLPLDDDMVGRVVRAGGFRWAVNRRRQVGDVVFNTALGAAVSRLRQCTRANGGR